MPQKSSSAALLDQLQQALVRRDVRTGFELLDRSFVKTTRLDYTAPYSISLLLSLAQWVDLGYRDTAFLDRFMIELTHVQLAQLPLLSFLRLRMTEAYRRLANERLEECVDDLDLVLRIGEHLLGDYLLFLAHFWKGRAHRKRGEYQQADHHLTLARAAAERARAPKLIAVTKIHQSWLAFQSGDRQHAFQLLDEAEAVLKSTGHALSLGNIESARGRFVRRSGEYARALGHFEAALAIYRRSYPDHPNLARALVNAAYVKRLIALDMKPKGGTGRAHGAIHAKALKITREALLLLDEARRIYALHHQQGGTGTVLVNTAHLHLESGNIDQASIEGQRGFDLGEEKRDQILMARSRTIQSAVELAQAEEQVGDQTDVGLHAHLAVQYAEQAIQLALQTQNKRLLAEAYITRGLAAAADISQDWEVAREFAGKAAALLSPEDRDHLYRTLGDLKMKLTGAMRVEDTLRRWSNGQLGNKSFQIIQEEFAELVIPKVWLQCEKNVTAVAKSLHISPKKVRRILRSTKHEMN